MENKVFSKLKKIFLTLLSVAMIFSCTVQAFASDEYRDTDQAPHSKAAILYEATTDTVFYEKNADMELPPASMTKVMTAILVLEQNPELSGTLTVSKDAVRHYYCSSMGYPHLKAGEVISYRDCMAYMLIPSANEAATSFAFEIGGDMNTFLQMMNDKAKELGCNKIALGHHFNDVIETTVMSMFYGSQLQAMPPMLHSTSFPGMTLIRPMYCIREEDILAWKRYNELEFIQCACRFTENCTMCDNGGGGSKRQETKILLRRLKRDNPNIENSIFRSIHAVALDTIPGYKSEGVEHSFLERFHAQEEAFNEE